MRESKSHCIVISYIDYKKSKGHSVLAGCLYNKTIDRIKLCQTCKIYNKLESKQNHLHSVS